MDSMKTFVFLLLMVLATISDASSHHHPHRHRRYYPNHRQENSRIDFVERKTDVGSENVADSIQTESSEKNKKHSETLNNVEAFPFSARRLERMLEKAILKIITGDLGTAEMLLLKSLNYTPEEVHAIRQREFERKRKDEELRKRIESGKRFYNENLYGNKANNWNYNPMEVDSTSRNNPDIDISANEKKQSQYNEKDFDFDKYNRQAVMDYEDRASEFDSQHSWSETTSLDYNDELRNSGEQDSMEPHVIFKIPYDDSEFDSSSDERLSKVEPKHRAPSTLRHTTAKNVANSFHASSLSSSSSPSASSATTEDSSLPVVYQLGRDFRSNYARKGRSFSTTPESETPEPVDIANAMFSTTESTVSKKTSEYEGLEWVEDDVYRVIPEFEDLQIYADENETSDYEGQNGNETDTLGYQNDDPDSDPDQVKLYDMNASNENASQANLSAYQQMMIAHHRKENVTSSFDSQSQKVIDDIKAKILMITGRLNHSTNTNQVQHERLAMYLPTCQIPRNTDSEAWTDQFSMNMHFQLNLTSVDHIAAAKLRIYKLPQENLTSSVDENEDDEKKIRISVYYYTKALKKHRPKKRLMDSVVTPLTAHGSHYALDVRQGLRFWRLNSQDSQDSSNNHGLVIQIEDQDGRPLKPADYIQQPSCENRDLDQKSNACLHFSSEPALLTFAS